MLQSGAQSIFVNRIHWAVTYLSKAGLLARPVRVRVQITDAGQVAMAGKPAKMTIQFLMDYPSFVALRAKSKPKGASESAIPISEENPEELLYLTYDALRHSIEADMLDRLQAPEYPWEAFERLVVELLGAMGTGVRPTRRRSGSPS